MKRAQRRNSRRGRTKMKSAPSKTLLSEGYLAQPQRLLQQQQLQSTSCSSLNAVPSCFQNLVASESAVEHLPPSSDIDMDIYSGGVDEKDFILSQDFFCTPDYITPECQNTFTTSDNNKGNISCPNPPEKMKTTKSKILKQDSISAKSPDSPLSDQQIVELSKDNCCNGESRTEKTVATGSEKGLNYVSQSAVSLRCHVMPPPCVKNPYLKDVLDMDVDPFCSWRLKCSGYFPASIGADCLSRYRTDFHEIEQIGNGNFSRVFKVLKRIDGCLYAVKHITRQLHQDTERRKALMEVQALAALGFHENIVAYYSSWFENEQLYIQMELCDCSLAIQKSSLILTEGEVLQAIHQIAKALEFVHERGIAHLDVKPDNIYLKNGVYKLGDFGCARLLDASLPIDEGDARYMPQEILNETYDHLDKVDIFSLGVSMYEVLRGSPLPDSGPQILNLREGKLSLLPTFSLQLQNLLKVMVDPDPNRRPSAKEIVENPIFHRVLGNAKSNADISTTKFQPDDHFGKLVN
ncbi:hypothetical protein Nepgr_027836 [Nepenthes gracilis]|uniref:Wee1-like protein kinase n=1 Tax=Nepenthes gracilis TaxID=150966 RepID=A0AAD3Y1S4_NEPGR|nr:hypothetical protein Nepgr_027836 [Nepenthes gracilis]